MRDAKQNYIFDMIRERRVEIKTTIKRSERVVALISIGSWHHRRQNIASSVTLRRPPVLVSFSIKEILVRSRACSDNGVERCASTRVTLKVAAPVSIGVVNKRRSHKTVTLVRWHRNGQNIICTDANYCFVKAPWNIDTVEKHQIIYNTV